MPLNNIKEITIPEGSVKKIEDNDGNIIWGSQTAFPYRRLEYLNFSGTELIDTLETPKVGFYYLTAIVPDTEQGWSFIWGAGHTTDGTFYRLFWQTNGVQFQSRIKADTQNSNVNLSDNIREFRCRVYATNNTTGEFWRSVLDMTGVDLSGTPPSVYGSQLWGLKTNNTSYAVNFNNFNTTLAIGRYHNNNTWSNPGNALIGKVYRYYTRSGNDSSAITHLMFPAQRKSDGRCGLYDTVTSTFYPMSGTNITTSAAGPVIDEYWDLTA